MQFGPGAPVEHYFAGLKASGRSPEETNAGYWGPPVHVVATEAELSGEREFARRLAGEREKEYSPEGRDVAFTGAAAANRERAFPEPIIGTPDQVLRALTPMFEKSPFTHLVLWVLPHQLELCAREVLPTLRRWGRDPVPASRRSAPPSPRHAG